MSPLARKRPKKGSWEWKFYVLRKVAEQAEERFSVLEDAGEATNYDRLVADRLRKALRDVQ